MSNTNNLNLTQMSLRVNATDEKAGDIGQRLCEVIKTEFGVEATLIKVCDCDEVDYEQDVVRTSSIEGVILLHYIGAYGDPVRSDEFRSYDAAKAAAEHAVTSRTNKANWYQLEIISSNGSQMWFWDGHTAYDFYVN